MEWSRDVARWPAAPFPHPAHRTVLADFPHTALGQGLMRSLTRSCASDPPGGSGPEFGGGMCRETVTSLDPPPGVSDTASGGAYAARGYPPRGRPVCHLVQPPVQAVRLDVLERLVIDPRCAAVGTAADVGPSQHVATVHLVVQHVEPIVGRSLRFGMQRLLEFLNPGWR